MMDRIIRAVESKRAEYWDLRLVKGKETFICASEGKIERVSGGESWGFGVRFLNFDSWGFGFSDSLDKVEETVQRAHDLSKIPGSGEKIVLSEEKFKRKRFRTFGKIGVDSISLEEKMNEMKEFSKEEGILISFSDFKGKEIFYNSEGAEMEWEFERTSLRVRCVLKSDGKMVEAFEGESGFLGLEIFEKVENLKMKARRKAEELIRAKSCPKGKFLVIIDPELSGVIAHEAFGHAAEADHVLARNSALENKLGQVVASEMVSISDDPTIEGLSGFYPFDDEGVMAKKTKIVENGVLKGYLHSRETAAKFGVKSTSNFRAQSYGHFPQVRMSNTFIEPGDWKKEEIFEVKEAIYAVGSSGGEVKVKDGYFQFTAELGYLIKNGERTPIKNVGLSGNILELLKKVDAVCDDLTFKPGVCGKSGQSVPVSTGGPHIRVVELWVGV